MDTVATPYTNILILSFDCYGSTVWEGITSLTDRLQIDQDIEFHVFGISEMFSGIRLIFVSDGYVELAWDEPVFI